MLRGFKSYAHADRDLVDGFLVHLRAAEKWHSVNFWIDHHISAGQTWTDEIGGNINKANEFILMMTAAFFASEYIHFHEREPILERAAKCNALIVPIKLDHCRSSEWQPKLQAAPLYEGALTAITDPKFKTASLGYHLATEQLFAAMDTRFGTNWR